MRRQMDLAREILFRLEECPYTVGWHKIEIEGYSPEEISHHVFLLRQAGLVEAVDLTTLSSPYPEWRPHVITWDGHEFLENARDNTRWEKAKAIVKEKGGTMTLEALKLTMSELVRRSLANF